MRLLLVVLEASRPQRLVEDGLKVLTRRGHEIELCALGPDGPLLDLARHLGAGATSLGGRGTSRLAATAPALRGVVRRCRPQVVHANEPLPAIVAGIAAAATPTIYHRHHLAGAGRLRLASWVATRTTDVTVAVSQAVADRSRSEDRRDPARVLVARNGVEPLRPVDDAEVAALRARLGIGPGTVVLAIARLRAEKGLDHLLAALPHIRATTVGPVHVVLVGAGPEEAALRGAIPTDRPGGVHLVGHQDDVAPWYRLADIVVLPSLREGLPLAAIEAMASARAVVASSVGGLVEVVEPGTTGLLVPPSDPIALAEAISRLASDPGRREAMGAAGTERWAAEFSAEAMVTGWERAYAVAAER